MKDIVISAARIRTEIVVFLSLFVLSNLANIAAIIYFGKPWIEVFSQIGYVIVISGVLYVIAGILRLLFFCLKKLFSPGDRKKNQRNR